jgi:hypothetical protein
MFSLLFLASLLSGAIDVNPLHPDRLLGLDPIK